jgi:type II secretory pathway pseudopilin PulG
MSMTKKIVANQLGDTIIEVMVVLAVLGLAIGISYSTANRSLLNARQAQENSQATGLVQTQVENLRLLVANSTSDNTDPTTNIFLPTTPYCINNPLGSSPIDTDQADCTHTLIPYTVLIYNCNKIPSGPCANVNGPDTLVVEATWPDVLGQGNDSVILDYRLHSP